MLKCECQRVKRQLKKSYESNCKSITFRLTFSDLHGPDDNAIINSQLDSLVEAYEEKKDMILKMSKTQLAYIYTVAAGLKKCYPRGQYVCVFVCPFVHPSVTKCTIMYCEQTA